MRRILVGILAFGACLLVAFPARAGVYASFEKSGSPPPDTGRQWILNLRSLASLTPEKIAKLNRGDLRIPFVLAFDYLLAQEQAGPLTTLQRVDLGACYLRRMKWAEAIRVLEKGDQKHFLILTNLASAYQGMGQLDRAIYYQQAALKAWPATWVWWSEVERRWYRRVEEYYLKLLNLRASEEARSRGRVAPITTVDNLFPGVRFVGPSGEYEAGNLVDSMWTRLPSDCFMIVYQLLFWYPHDARLHWLWGELLNGYAGRFDLASEIFEDLVYSQGMSGVRELLKHRRVLLSAVEIRSMISKKNQKSDSKKEDQKKADDLRMKFWQTLYTLADVQPVACGVSPFLHQVGAAAVPVAIAENKISVQQPEPAPDVTLPPSIRPLPSWRQISVGFIAGAAFAALVALQLRERRRRQAANSAVLIGADENAAPSGTAEAGASRKEMPGPG